MTATRDVKDEDISEPEQMVVGVIADPEAAPVTVARDLVRGLPDLLADQVPDCVTWSTEVRHERLPPTDRHHTVMMDVAANRLRDNGWDIAVCITDLPLRAGHQPIVADMSSERRVVIVSLPAFGAMSFRRGVRTVVAQLIADMCAGGTPPEGSVEHRRRRIGALGAQFRRVTPDVRGVDVRVLASRGGFRLLVGMVRNNQPWRLVLGLTWPTVGAVAFSGFYLLNSTVWQVALAMGLPRLVGILLGSVAIMVAWLIIHHRLWERTRGRGHEQHRDAMLYNASTLFSVLIGVGVMGLGLCLLNTLVALVVLTPQVFAPYTGGLPGPVAHLFVGMLVTAAALIAGAVGSGFETEAAVHEAAYSWRERERRRALERDDTSGTESSR